MLFAVHRKKSRCIFRDLVHRQTAISAVRHMALGVYGFGCEDALTHLLNFVWPNVFETSPHLVQAFFDCVDAMRVSLGPGKMLTYILQVTYILTNVSEMFSTAFYRALIDKFLPSRFSLLE